MADFSGGQAYFPSFISHLPQIYSAIGKDLSSQYTIAYYPVNRARDGKWRTINIRVKGRPNLAIRHRKGYYAN
jgi:VWFA-related protein